MMVRACVSSLFVSGCLLGVVLLTGCRTADRVYEGTTGVMNPDKTRLQGGIRWMSPHPPLRDVQPNDMVVYLRVRNTTGVDLDIVDLMSRIRAGYESMGYRVTNNIDDAHFVVRADVRAFGENREKNLGVGALATTAIGAGTGAIIGHQVHHSNESTVIGGVVGAAAGGLLANTMANRNKMVEYDLVVDLRIGERVQGGVDTTRRSDDTTRVQHADSVGIAQQGRQGGTHQGGSSETQHVEMQEDFLYHQNRLVAYAVRMNLAPEEAFPYLTQKIATALSGILP